MNDKSCQAVGCCSYKTYSGSIIGCSYSSYCDYQLPKDSRIQCEVGQEQGRILKIITQKLEEYGMPKFKDYYPAIEIFDIIKKAIRGEEK